MDLIKALDRIRPSDIRVKMTKCTLEQNNINSECETIIRTRTEISKSVYIANRIRQEHSLSPFISNIIMYEITDMKQNR